MTNDIWIPPPWEPPIDGTEAEHLTGALERMRATLRWKADGLDEAGLRQRIPSSSLSLVVRNTRRIEDALAEGGLEVVAHVDDGNGNHPRLRRLLVDLLEEYSRHTGHTDLLREAVDGRVGEDAPR